MGNQGPTTLVVVAHPDDEVLGCGGTIKRWAKEGRAIHLLTLSDGEGARFSDEKNKKIQKLIRRRNLATAAAAKLLGIESVKMLNFPDNRMDSVDLLDIVKAIESVIDVVKPECVLTHHFGDVNIDHRIAYEAVLAACRPQPGNVVRQLLFFEVPSSTEWRPPGASQQFAPNLFVDISGTLDKKLAALVAYKSELREFPHPRSVAAVKALANWRGASCGVDAAEAFCLGRLII